MFGATGETVIADGPTNAEEKRRRQRSQSENRCPREWLAAPSPRPNAAEHLLTPPRSLHSFFRPLDADWNCATCHPCQTKLSSQLGFPLETIHRFAPVQQTSPEAIGKTIAADFATLNS